MRIALMAGAALLAAIGSARADSISIGFEPPYTPGSINAQQGWGGQNPPGIPINTNIDQAVTTAASHSGTQSFRESSVFTSGTFGDQIFSPSLTDAAGEPGAISGGFSSGPAQPRFTATYWFRSATPVAQDAHVVVSPDRGDGARMSWIQVSDNIVDPAPADGRQGLSVSFYDYRVPPPMVCQPGDLDGEGKCFVFQVLATNLSRTDWHRIDIDMEFYDGKANDVVHVQVDGGPVQGGTSWEDYFPNNQGVDFPTDPPTVDSLLFRVGGDPEGNSGEGFFFDDVSYTSGPCLSGTRFVTVGGDDQFNDCRNNSQPCLTVQHAVDVACVGDTVQVANGTFAEKVHIPKNVTVIGAGAGSTIIQAPATLPAAGDVVQIDGAAANDVEMSKLTVAGPGPSGCNSINAGIHVMNGAHADLHDLSVADIRDQPLSGCQNGRAIRVGDPGAPATAVVHDSSIVNYQKNGLDVRDPASTLDAHDNTITGPGATPLIASNGVVVVGSQAAIVHNAISGNECNHPDCGPDPINDTQSCGILLLPAAAGTTVSGNTISANDVGVYNTGTSSISGNTLTNNRFEGIALDEGNATVSLNTISGGNIGVAALSFTGNTGDSKGTLTCNHVTGALVAGIKTIDQNTGDTFVPRVGGTTNSIKGNMAGFVNTTTTGQTFTGNWWGCVAGPNGAGCDTVSGPVTTAPVATSVPACVSCSSAADCSDGLACNGAETCVAGSCQTGTPVVCFGDQCNTSACAEPSGTCVTTPKPNGTTCAAAPDTCSVPDSCQGGTCVDGGGGDPDGDLICSTDDNCPTVSNPGQEDLDNDGLGNVCDGSDAAINLTQAKFKKNSSASGANGSITLKGDFLTSGPGDAFNTSAPIGIQVSDHLVTAQSFVWTTCVASGTKIGCKSADRLSQAKFKQFGAPNQWKFVIKLKKRSITGPFQGPVKATITHDTGIDRTDDISDCRALNSGLNCREF